MSYLIDGHNLIPKVRGLSLQRLDDEMELIQGLQIFARVRRQTLEVYFDKAAPGRAGSVSYGLVKAIFVHESSSADEAIRLRLQKLGRKAQNWKVVSSDRQVQANARYSHAEVIPSEEFAVMLEGAILQAVKNPPDQKGLSEAEVDDWLKMFDSRDHDDDDR